MAARIGAELRPLRRRRDGSRGCAGRRAGRSLHGRHRHPKVAELVPARVGHLVFLAAVVLPSGTSLDQQFPLAARAIFTGGARAGGGAVQYPAAMAHARWMGDMPAGDERLTRALALLTPQPLRPWRERVDMSQFNAVAIPRTSIRCLRDAAIHPA